MRQIFLILLTFGILIGLYTVLTRFEPEQGQLTGFAVREDQQTTPLTGNTAAEQQQAIQQNVINDTPNVQENQNGGASAQFQVAARIVG